MYLYIKRIMAKLEKFILGLKGVKHLMTIMMKLKD
jgi:hypothetical protein